MSKQEIDLIALRGAFRRSMARYLGVALLIGAMILLMNYGISPVHDPQAQTIAVGFLGLILIVVGIYAFSLCFLYYFSPVRRQAAASAGEASRL